MKNLILYVVTVLIWGSTWLAIEFQLGVVSPEVSLVYRFAMAALMMWGYCLYKKLPMRFNLVQHGFFILLALCNFGFNYLLLYWAQQYLTSALASVAFSTMLLINIINTRIFFGKPIAKRIYSGALLGIAGIVVLFWQDLQVLDLSNLVLVGLLLALSGTLVASFGNMVSVRNSRRSVGILQGNAWGMLYGTSALAITALFTGAEFTFDPSLPYVASLLYLAVFGTVIAFACYFVMLKNIGPEKASYVIVLFPLVAVVLSTLFEGFVWNGYTLAGFSLVLAGNAIVLTPFERIGRLLGKRPAVIPEPV
ncbi:EamA family transporter [Aliiglaciecola sp. CAU 1673]|uniref:DMT family transporter n=1 Tax=Aliiglaciecola sp. CAU 1673 TaxID=3032595 RepID=UPI0023DB38AA|nr:EamA family transporter [Aliiglaciecola sp. CAU 1673]MDF2179358.1 EamA family transporter [Aliiglaciecola sp. CAU 1673]